MEAVLAAASGGGETQAGADGAGGEGQGAAVDPAKRGKALSKKIKKLEAVKAKKDAGESINAVGHCFALSFVATFPRVSVLESLCGTLVFCVSACTAVYCWSFSERDLVLRPSRARACGMQETSRLVLSYIYPLFLYKVKTRPSCAIDNFGETHICMLSMAVEGLDCC